MRRLCAIHLTVAATLSVLSAMSIAARAQPEDSQQPAKSSDENEPPPGGCNPIGLTASGEIVFPMTCRAFIERHKALDRNSSASEVKPTAADDDKADAKEAKPAATQASTNEEPKPVGNQVPAGPAEISRSGPEPATTASVPKRSKARNRLAGPPGCTKFRTYDATSGTYRTYDGRRRLCRPGEAILVVE
jgi:hypothetical protein